MSASIYMLEGTRTSRYPLRITAETEGGVTELWIRDADNTVAIDLSRAEVSVLMAVLALAIQPVAVAVSEAA